MGFGFRGIPSEIETALSNRLINFNTTPLIPDPYVRIGMLETFVDICRFSDAVFREQADTLNRNVEIYRKNKRFDVPVIKKKMGLMKEEAVDMWLKTYPVGKLARNKQL
jgi:hypothetical protein